MMFASDLDRTLIFSNKALADYPSKDPLDMIPIERKLGEPISYMTRRSYDLLQDISKKILFVPVTTRTLSQYNRIAFDRMNIMYAVTSNGANILYQGQPLMEWSNRIRRELLESAFQREELISMIKQRAQGIKGELRAVEDLFFYYYLDESISSELFNEIEAFIDGKNWKVSLQGRKLYFMPAAISKGKAIAYIREREEKSTLIGAGDSLFDDDFLQISTFPFVPGHGELAHSHTLQKRYVVTENKGAKGGEELLESILQLITKNDSASDYSLSHLLNNK
ncbi:HAD family hydrolase [Bacillus dakarensis]|uniref:HAD family hydrolase n=1 Tax=Robertmurraya dakarensis TaxID=1926278 RepID=UPI000980EA5A|nr:HAD family hydrolase [Bacillus dakarensis]